MPHPTGPKLVLFGPDDKHGAKPRKGFKTYRWYAVWHERGQRYERGLGVEYGGDVEGAFGAWLVERASKERPQGPRGPDTLTVGEALRFYGQEHAPNTADPGRIAEAIVHLLTWLGASTPLASVTAGARRRYQTERQTPREHTQDRGTYTVKRTYGVAASTARKELGILDAAARHCVREGYLTYYAEDQWLPPKSEPSEEWLTRKQVADLLRARRKKGRTSPHMTLFIITAIYTGRRLSAILSLQWQPNTEGDGWVDLERGVIDFRRGTENKKRRGTVPIVPRLMTFLRLARKRTTKYVFETVRRGPDGRPVYRHAVDIYGSLQEAAKVAGIKHIHPHLLKHTAVTWLIERGVSFEDISAWTETTMATLEQVYAKRAPGRLARVIEALR